MLHHETLFKIIVREEEDGERISGVAPVSTCAGLRG